VRILVPLAVTVALGCNSAVVPPPPEPREPDEPFVEILLDAAPPGLSGLAADAGGVLWAVAERAHEIARITLRGVRVEPDLARLPIAGVPADTDLEGLEVLPDGSLAIATEGQRRGVASVLWAARDGAGFRITSALELPADRLGVTLTSNHGAESVCGDARALAVGIEVVGEVDGRRYAPVVRIVDGAVVAVQRLWLTSDTGKLGALECTIAADGAVTGWGIERHYGVTRVIRVALPPPGTDGDQAAATMVDDLEVWFHGRLNLEGIAELPDGRIAIVNDSATAKTIAGTELLLFTKDGMGVGAGIIE
jgi:hypothetical protein